MDAAATSRFVGIDMGWSTGATGLAAVDDAGHLTASARVNTDEEIAEWLAAHAGRVVVAAVDAPLIVPNETGQRVPERLIGQAFGAFGASAHTSNRMRFGGGDTRAMRLATRFGWAVDPEAPTGAEVTVCIEVYPHPAMINPDKLTVKSGEAVNDANRGYYNVPGQVLQDSLYPDRRLRHTTSAIGASWEPGEWLRASLMTGRDRVVDRWRLDEFRPGATAPAVPEYGGDENWRLTTAARVVSSYHVGGGVAGSTALVLDWWKNKVETSDSVGVAPAVGTSETQFTMRSRSASFLQAFDFPHGVSVNGSFHRVMKTLFGSDQPWEWFPAANISWRLPPLRNDRSAVKLRVAYAELPGAAPSLATLLSLPVGPPQSGGGTEPKMERTKSLELGVDASLDRLGSASVSLFRSTSTNLLTNGPPGPGGQPLLTDGEIRNSGVEALLHALLVERGTVQWTTTISLAALSNRVSRLVAPPLISSYGITREGSPVGAVRVVPYTFTDANHDGIIDVSEVQLLPAIAKPSLPTFEAGIGSELRLARDLTLSALGDYRHGNFVANASGRFRCVSRRNCRAAQDPTASLEDQAAAAAAVASGGDLVTGFVSDGSFFKLRELALHWQLPEAWSHFLGGHAALTIAGRNLLTSTSYSGLDPEISTAPPGVLPRVEFTRNPIPREILVRFDLGDGAGR